MVAHHSISTIHPPGGRPAATYQMRWGVRAALGLRRELTAGFCWCRACTDCLNGINLAMPSLRGAKQSQIHECDGFGGGSRSKACAHRIRASQRAQAFCRWALDLGRRQKKKLLKSRKSVVVLKMKKACSLLRRPNAPLLARRILNKERRRRRVGREGRFD